MIDMQHDAMHGGAASAGLATEAAALQAGVVNVGAAIDMPTLLPVRSLPLTMKATVVHVCQTYHYSLHPCNHRNVPGARG
jgi:hypothetical protein